MDARHHADGDKTRHGPSGEAAQALIEAIRFRRCPLRSRVCQALPRDAARCVAVAWLAQLLLLLRVFDEAFVSFSPILANRALSFMHVKRAATDKFA